MPRAGVFASARVAPSGGGGGALTYQANASDATDAASFAFSALAIGAASATRRVIVGIGYASGISGVTVSSVTIGGVAATMDVDSLQGAGSRHVYLWSAVVPTGTTATVVVTLTNTIVRIGIGVWTMGAGAPTGQTATLLNVALGTLTVTTSPGDSVVAFGFASGSVLVTTTWSGDAIERFDTPVESTSAYTGADAVASGSSVAMTFSNDVSTAQRAWAAAAYA